MPLQGIPSIMGAGIRHASALATIGINFRATAGFVTDVAPDTYCLPTDTYPTTRGGYTFGWETAFIDGRDRNSGVNAELAGINFRVNGASVDIFRLALTAGTYDIRLALGDGYGNNPQDNYITVEDDFTPLITFSPLLTGAQEFGDAAGNVWTQSAWVANNVAVSKTFSSTILRIIVSESTGSNSSCIAHLGLVQTA